MDFLIYHYQHLPSYLSPIAFNVGSFAVEWYSLMYLIGFASVYFLLKFRLKKKELPVGMENFDAQKMLDLLLIVFGGMIIGARLGYAIFYNPSYFWHHPGALIWPWDGAGNFIGIYGMSYHGGLLGALASAWFFIRKNKKYSFRSLSDFIVPALPAGYFFGRLGNFFNGELYGRAIGQNWGMFFPTDPFGLLRHPSQLYEAFLEGLLLFVILWSLRNNLKVKSNLLPLYLIGYALARILVEFFREPDEQIGYLLGFLTLGQILSFGMILAGFFLIFHKRKVVV